MRVLVEAWVVRPLFTYLIAAPLTFAIIAFVAVGVNLWIGADDLPPELAGSTPWMVGIGVALLAVTALVAWRGRIKVRLVESQSGRYLEVYDPKGVILVPAPMTCKYAWYRDRLGKSGTQTLLTMGVFHEGACKVVFRETWGGAYEPPMTWPEGILVLDAPVAYDALLGTFLVELVDGIEA